MKKFLLAAVASAAFAGAMVSCSSDDSKDTTVNPDEIQRVLDSQKHENFKVAFVEEFGQPYADQDWGFGTDPATARTRAGEPDMLASMTPEEVLALSVDELKDYGFKRIIAEDLTIGENSDMDYNDIVFDARRVVDAGSGDYATFYLIVRATGAMKRIYVGDEDAEGSFEVHTLFEMAEDSVGFVNTAYKPRAKDDGAYWARNHAPVFVALKVKKNGTEEPTLIDIPIRVGGNTLELTAKRGQPAEKLCVDCDYSWLTEGMAMKNWYPTFQHYVTGDELEQAWWHNYYWDSSEEAPTFEIIVNGKSYKLEFEQENAYGPKQFYTTRSIRISAYVLEDGEWQLLPLGSENLISVLCNGDHGHFSRSISYNADHTATLNTPSDERSIYHAPVTITLTVDGSSTRVKSDITIWPRY